MASIKERMAQALRRSGLDVEDVEVSKNSQGYWEAHVGDVILRVRRGEAWVCAGDEFGRGSCCSDKTGLSSIENILESAIYRRDIAKKIISEVSRWTRMEARSPSLTDEGTDILVSTPSGAIFWVVFSGRSFGRRESVFVSEVSTGDSSTKETDLARELLYKVINSVL